MIKCLRPSVSISGCVCVLCRCIFIIIDHLAFLTSKTSGMTFRAGGAHKPCTNTWKFGASTEVNELLPVTPKTTSINTNTRIHTPFSFLILPQSYIFTCGDNHQHPLGCFRVSSWPAGALCGCVCVLKRLLPLGSLCQYSVSVGQQHGAIRPAPTASPQNALHTNRTNSSTFTYWTALLLGAFVRPPAFSCSLWLAPPLLLCIFCCKGHVTKAIETTLVTVSEEICMLKHTQTVCVCTGIS